MFEELPSVLTFFLRLIAELIPLFLLVTFLVGLSLEFISRETLRRHLSGKRQLQGTVLATILGYVTPFCSCSTVPIAVAMLGASIPLGLVVAFVFASPYPVEIGVFVLGPVFGWPFAVTFSVLGMALALLMGMLVDKFNWQDQINSDFNEMVTTRTAGLESENDHQQCECETHTGERNVTSVLKNAMMYSLGFLKKLFPYVILGSLVGTLIYGYMPEEIILQYAGSSNIFAVPIAALIGVPLYTSSSMIIPIIYSLYLKGMSGGAVTALLITAMAISPPELLMLSKMFKRKIMVTFVVSMIVGAITIGYLFNLIRVFM